MLRCIPAVKGTDKILYKKGSTVGFDREKVMKNRSNHGTCKLEKSVLSIDDVFKSINSKLDDTEIMVLEQFLLVEDKVRRC